MLEMTIAAFNSQATSNLKKAGIGTAELDVLVLLEDALKKDRAWILAHPEAFLQGRSLQILDKQIARRGKHEPLAYIRGKTEFYGREFYVDNRVLEPRPESETMITLLKTLVSNKFPYTKDRPLRVVDIGTGSGALAITAKLEKPNIEAAALDIDPSCLRVAHKNARSLGVKIKFYQGDLLYPLPLTRSPLFAILANLPYVPNDFTINQAAAMEPKIAIFGGPDGLDVYRRLFGQIGKLKSKPQYILTESLPPQHAKLAKIAQKAAYGLAIADDFIQVFKLKE